MVGRAGGIGGQEAIQRPTGHISVDGWLSACWPAGRKIGALLTTKSRVQPWPLNGYQGWPSNGCHFWPSNGCQPDLRATVLCTFRAARGPHLGTYPGPHLGTSFGPHLGTTFGPTNGGHPLTFFLPVGRRKPRPPGEKEEPATDRNKGAGALSCLPLSSPPNSQTPGGTTPSDPSLTCPKKSGGQNLTPSFGLVILWGSVP